MTSSVTPFFPSLSSDHVFALTLWPYSLVRWQIVFSISIWKCRKFPSVAQEVSMLLAVLLMHIQIPPTLPRHNLRSKQLSSWRPINPFRTVWVSYPMDSTRFPQSCRALPFWTLIFQRRTWTQSPDQMNILMISSSLIMITIPFQHLLSKFGQTCLHFARFASWSWRRVSFAFYRMRPTSRQVTARRTMRRMAAYPAPGSLYEHQSPSRNITCTFMRSFGISMMSSCAARFVQLYVETASGWTTAIDGSRQQIALE